MWCYSLRMAGLIILWLVILGALFWCGTEDKMHALWAVVMILSFVGNAVLFFFPFPYP